MEIRLSKDVDLQDFWESFLDKRLSGFHLMELLRFSEAKWTLSFLSCIDSSVASQPLRPKLGYTGSMINYILWSCFCW
ncbi:hypothetical protein GOP47_0001513 [Adiantum capillus-veneris]|uniref:Uncharacterized protein n=1 Tax=Adiantum capillus-veneris TaxID=13818 RepID=A0A9D4V966_ADICA|nr:hypothetical protein GOP47_0001513 [Adiantum capillus-veneris]